jgi:hypothetical protein
MYDKDIVELTDFHGAIDLMLDGRKVTRLEWKDKRHYCVLQEDMLQIHKKGERKDVLHPWIINNGDLGGLDWYKI